MAPSRHQPRDIHNGFDLMFEHTRDFCTQKAIEEVPDMILDEHHTSCRVSARILRETFMCVPKILCVSCEKVFS